jgi:acyl carrier protein
VVEKNVITVDQERLNEIAWLAADLFSVSAEEVLAAESFINDLGTDSLLTIDLITQLDKRYGIRIPDAAAERLVNLRSTYEVVAACAGW